MSATTEQPANKPAHGWGRPALARGWHYFPEGRSLCGRWLFFGELDNEVKATPDDCRTCRRKLEKRK